MLREDTLRNAIANLLHELSDGPAAEAAWVLNPGDRGLTGALDALSVEDASARIGGRSSIASHVDHVRYGLELMNRWASGEENPFATANYSQSWQRQRVNAEEWRNLREALARELQGWERAVREPRDLDGTGLTGMIASVVHLAYHLGAIRQLNGAIAGPRAKD
jgi:hypothetical protein